ncbi:hypothetical protein T08_81, partial [Trichinella sp. T8]
LSSTASILSSSSSVRRRSNRALLAASFLDSDLAAAAIPHGDYGYPLGDACRLRLGGPNILLGQPNAGSQEDGRASRMQADRNTQRIYVRFIRLRINQRNVLRRQQRTERLALGLGDPGPGAHLRPRPWGTICADGVTPAASVAFRTEHQILSILHCVTSRFPGRARSSPQQGCCHGHY